MVHLLYVATLLFWTLQNNEGKLHNVTCPELNLCACAVRPSGLDVRCKGVGNVEAIPEELSKLRGQLVSGVQIVNTELRTISAFYFETMTIAKLLVQHCSLESMDDKAFSGMGPMRLLDLSDNNLTTIPSALRALPSLSKLRLSGNKITVLDLGLAHLSASLSQLFMDRNLIERIDENAFRNFTRLSLVDLTTNKIRAIPRSLFRDMHTLDVIRLKDNHIEDANPVLKLRTVRVLYLSKNNITSVAGLPSPTSSSLRVLFLDRNPIARISAVLYYNLEKLSVQECDVASLGVYAFADCAHLTELTLSRNRISFIPGTAFHKESPLKQLVATDNSISTLEGTFNATRRLQIINLSFNKIRDITNAFATLKELKTLNLNGNLMEFVADMTFGTNGNLKNLDLARNKIKGLGKHAFHGLVNLDKLLLDGNRLLVLNGSLSFMPRLRHLFIEHNQLTTIEESDFLSTPQLRFIRANGNNISDVRGAFIHLKHLKSIQLEDNRLQHVHRLSFFSSLASLEVIALKGNPLFCDCQSTWLLSIVNNGTPVRNPKCTSPARLHGLTFLNVSEDMLRESPEDCDSRCSCTCQPDKQYGKSTYVRCSNASLSATPKTFPSDSRLIDLSGNNLRTLDGTLIDTVPHVETLLLSRNSLSTLSAIDVPKSLKRLDLRNNRFTRFPTDAVIKLNLTALWLSGNKWICDCESYDFKLWTQSNELVIKDAAFTICAEGSNPHLYGKPLVTVELRDFCLLETSKIIFTVPVFVLLIIILSAAMIYLKRERQIKVWLFSRGLLCAQDNDVDKDKLFDVFLSFSSKDFDWAYANLIPRLEHEGFRVCTYDRNFKGGFLLQDIIQEAVSCSCRTLLLLTRNFVESDWCRWEFRVVHRNALHERINRLVVVVTEDIPDNVDKELLAYMRATSYLRWGERHFWDKLKYSLPRRDGRRRTSTLPPDSMPLSIIPSGLIPHVST